MFSARRRIQRQADRRQEDHIERVHRYTSYCRNHGIIKVAK